VHRSKAAQPRVFNAFSPSQEIPMYATGAFKNPFADFDFSKFAGEFKFPMVNVETIVEATRKNFAALTTANTTAVESMKAIAQRQGDMVRAAMEDFSKHGSDVLGAATVEEKAAKQIDFVKKSYEAAIANTKELTELYSKGHTEAFAALSHRVSELTEEVKAAIAKK
jgi:phasin family protein